MNWVKNAVEGSWESVSAVNFTDWGSCNSRSKGIRVQINDEGPHTKGLGSELNSVQNGMVLNFTFQRWNPSCQSKRENCIKVIAVHEFGHALGFAHEQVRPDTPSYCTKEKQGSPGDRVIGAWDLASVMNYCNPNWNGGGNLSGTDIQGVQIVYGKAPSDPSYDLEVATDGENVLYYDRSAGRAVISNNSSIGGGSIVKSYTGFRTTWRHIVYLDSKIILFYDSNAGEGEFYSIDAQGTLSLIRKYTGFRTTWRHIVYLGSNMILFYDGDAGEGEVYRFNASAELSLLQKYTGWRTTWEKIISAGERITFIESGTGHSESYSVDSAGNLF
jgi:hypothetical protein